MASAVKTSTFSIDHGAGGAGRGAGAHFFHAARPMTSSANNCSNTEVNQKCIWWNCGLTTKAIGVIQSLKPLIIKAGQKSA